MRRVSLGLALALSAIVAGCGGGKTASGTTASGAAKGVYGQYYYLAVSASTGGTVTSGDSLINCASDGTGCGDSKFHQTKYAWGTQVTLTAAPVAGFAFQQWGGDCSGTATTCTLNGTNAATDYTVVAVFKNLNDPKPVSDNTPGRVYGYVKYADGTGAAGVSVSLGAANAKSSATGAYVFGSVLPGSYQVATSAGQVPVTVPVVSDAACVKGQWPGAGCLVKLADITVAGSAPVLPTVTKDVQGLAGFGATVNVTCTPPAGDTVASWTATGPSTVTIPAAATTFSFQTTDVATAITAASLRPEGRPGFLSINQDQAGKLTYKFTCKTAAGVSATASVPMVAAVNANMATALRGELDQPLYLAPANGLPGVTGPLWATGAETTTIDPYGATFRAHDSVNVPTGVILITDESAARTWKFCGAATDSSAGTCAAPSFTVPTINNNGTANAWFVANWTAGKTVYLAEDGLPAVVTTTTGNYTGEPNIPVKASEWAGFVNSCDACHNPTATEVGPLEPVYGWKASKHYNAMVDGGSSDHFASSCLACHTMGFDASLNNSGFTAVLGSYQLPDFYFEGSTPALWTADLQANAPRAYNVGNVQCESCHGPVAPNPIPVGAHLTGHTASMSSKVCGTCHNGHNDQYGQWAQSGHADLSVAQQEGPLHGRDQTHCARCHFAQGFMAYVPQLKSGNPDKLGNAGPTGSTTSPILCAPYKTDATKDACPTTQTNGLVTAQNIDAITCQTCHDPHETEVRMKGSDANGLLLAGGFKIYNAGAGTLCASCHNSRNGIVGAVAPNLNNGTASVAGTALQHNDATGLDSAIGLTPPHDAAQADVYFAGNGYLLGQTPKTVNFHQDKNWFADTCAECHVKRTSAATAGSSSNHTFKVDSGTCVNCHGVGTDLLAMRKNIVANQLAAYQVTLANVLNSAAITSMSGKLNGATTPTTYTVPAGVTISTATPSGGYLGVTVDLVMSNKDTLAGVSLNSVVNAQGAVLYSLAADGTTKVYGNVAKSLYDWYLVNNDRSSGVHNIPFVDAMLDAMVNHLDAGTGVYPK